MLKYNFSTLEIFKKFNLGNFIAKFNGFLINFRNINKYSEKLGILEK